MKIQPAFRLSSALWLSAVIAYDATADNASDATDQLKKHPSYQTGYLSKEESTTSFVVPDGYELQLVLSEPEIKEPVAIAWDGNGVMYVAEMRTYMQDADATGEQTPTSRISRHEDTDGDGIYDKHSVFIDKLLLPRMILPLDDRLMVGVTNTLDLWNYRDTDGDGIADEKVKIHAGGHRGGNMEHQPSGLIWGLDNWIYLTYESTRYRFTDGELVTEKLPRGGGQWGLSQDDDGRNYYSRAGGEVVAHGFQQPAQYGLLEIPGQIPQSFQRIYPIAAVPDVQGGPRRVGQNGAINYFTGVAGQEIYRGDSLPSDLYGDLFTPEPVGRFIRRAKVVREKGKTTLRNATPGREFLSTRDVNFRPVQNVTGPDGCLYIVDMHRGIIQQGNWTRPGSYLREIIDRTGLDKNIGHGRIYRLVHKDHTPGKMPKLMGKSAIKLVPHLADKNSWWRETAKKLIILHKDRQSALPALEALALDSKQHEQTRVTALWTLEGCKAISEKLALKLLQESSTRITTHAIRVSEPFLQQQNLAVTNEVIKIANSNNHPEVVLQLINSINYVGRPQKLAALEKQLLQQHQSLAAVQTMVKHRKKAIAAAKNRQTQKHRNAQFNQSIARGKATYEQICFACHGADGLGQPLAGQKGHFLAPSLKDSPRVLGSGKAVTLSLLHGMEGRINGKTYDGLMPAQQNNSDQWITDVSNYIRNSFGNKAPALTTKSIASIRKEFSSRQKAWTQQELETLDPPIIRDRKSWNITASHGSRINACIDGRLRSRFTSDTAQKPGMWLKIELPQQYTIKQMVLDNTHSPNDHPRSFRVDVSVDGETWTTMVKHGEGQSPKTNIDLASCSCRWIRITQTGTAKKNFWSINELNIYGAPPIK